MALAFSLLVAVVIVIAGGTSTATAQSSHAHKIVTPQEVKWGPAPAELPAGAQAAVLLGDPGKEGLFVLRLRLPKGYRVPPHTHSVQEGSCSHAQTERPRDDGDDLIRARPSPCSRGASSHSPQVRRTMSSSTKTRLSKSVQTGLGTSSTSIRRTIRARRPSRPISPSGRVAAWVAIRGGLPGSRTARGKSSTIVDRLTRSLRSRRAIGGDPTPEPGRTGQGDPCRPRMPSPERTSRRSPTGSTASILHYPSRWCPVDSPSISI